MLGSFFRCGGGWSALMLSLLAGSAVAQQQPTPPAPVAPAASGTSAPGASAAAPSTASATTASDAAAAPAPAAVAASSDDQDLREELRALQQRIATQEAELARQRAELQSMREAAAGTAGDEEAELAALMASPEVDAQVADIAEAPPLRVYGFMDVGFQRSWGGVFDTGLSPSTAATFVLGNVNVYFDAIPAQDWRALVEVRFTNLPDGGDQFNPEAFNLTRIDTSVNDTTAVHGGLTDIRLNGIVLERAHIDYRVADLLNVRAGVFLTPYGIWNVDHGAPARIMARPPAIVLSPLWPERQTGVELFGTGLLLPWSVEYHLYVSNGRQHGSMDFDNDKAFGGRLVLARRRPFGFRLGTSFFVGSAEDVRSEPGITSMGAIALVPETVLAYEEVGGGGDLSIDAGPLRIRAEAIAVQRIYEDGKRDGFAGLTNPDRTAWGGYVLAAYELPWYRIEPYAAAEVIYAPIPTLADGFAVTAGGVNLYFTAATQLRLYATYTWGVVLGGPDPENFDVKGYGARLVVAF